MKKGLLLSLVLLLEVGMSIGQAQILTFGLKAGGAYTITGTDAPLNGVEKKDLMSGQGGAFARVNLPIIFGIKGELVYTQRGFDIDAFGTTTKTRVGYVDFPVLISFGLLDIIEFDLGPQISFVATKSMDGPGNPEFDQTYPDFADMEIGFAVGADINLPKNLGAYLRYSQTYNKFTAGPGTEYTLNPGTIAVGLKYRIVGGS